MSSLLRREDGQALAIALAFMVLTIPLVTAALQFSSTVSLDAETKSRTLKDQYSALGAQQIAVHLLIQTLSETTTLIYINDKPVTSTVAKLIEPPPGAIPITPRNKGRPFTTKTAFPTSVAQNGTTTYTVLVENKHDEAVEIKKVKDDLPGDFSYVAGTTEVYDAASTLISTSDPNIKTDTDSSNPPVTFETLTWSMPANTTLDVLKTMTLTYVANAAAADGLYCNEAWVRPGGRRTTTGKTAKVTVGSTTEQFCHGAVVSNDKTVKPELVFGNSTTTYTFVVEIKNEGTEVLNIDRIDDFIRSGFSYVPGTVSSTPSELNPGEPNLKSVTKEGVEYERLRWRFNNDPVELATGTTWHIEYQATATLPRGFYANEVELRFDDKQLPKRATGEVAIVTVVDAFKITINVLGFVYECNVWFADDVYIGDFEVVDGCSLVS